jgi:hypothetical protein
MSGVDIDSVADTAPGPDAYVFPASAGGPLRATGFRDRIWAAGHHRRWRCGLGWWGQVR